jgi:hypothetical protein
VPPWWQWLDSRNRQPGTMQVVGLGHRPGHALELSAGRWLSLWGRTVLDIRTLASYRLSLESSRLEGYHVGGKGEALAFAQQPEHRCRIRPEERRLSLFHLSQGHDPAREARGKALVERIAGRFNARLAAGEFQQHFIEREKASTQRAR